jgi:membrane-associated protein
LFNPERINHFIEVGGYLFLFAIIFAETGLLIGFFLPGDSLLFVAGAFVALRPDSLNLYLLLMLLCVAAVAGDATGYLIGRRFGRRLFERPNSKLFKREHLVKTEQFYAKHGPKTIVLARFVPIVRTFAPTVAGVAGMSYPQFALYNICGGVGWICSMTLLGYFFGNIPILKEHLELLVLGVIFLSILPMILHWLTERKAARVAASPVESVARGLEVGEEH